MPILAVLGPGDASNAEYALAERVGAVAARAGWVVNPWVLVPIYTGSGSARNAFNVLSADLCVAIGGGPGTLSEIALALKSDTPVWCWRSWDLTPPPGSDRPLPRVFETADVLLNALEKELGPDS
jgi:predicted Rossmann-fold nucleotide-binding protein